MPSEKTIPAVPRPRWSITLLTLGGIPVRVHASFALFLAWIASQASSPRGALEDVLFVLCLFTCVVLHEFGHAMTARRFGLKTRDITLYPFGGVASLQGAPSAWAELWIALAGPAVNVVIAASLFPLVSWHGVEELQRSGDFISQLLGANVFLALFNLIPAIPMDGGRVLRALLALFRVRHATAIASRLSQTLSVILGVFALYTNNPILVIIAIFVFVNAMHEAVFEKTQIGAEGKRVSAVMTARAQLTILEHRMTLSEALDLALRSIQPAFPVLFGEQILGVIARDELLSEAAVSTENQYVSGLMDREFSVTGPLVTLDVVVKQFAREGRDPILVLEEDVLVGVVYREKLFEFLYLHGIRRSIAAKNSDAENHHQTDEQNQL